MMNIHVRYFAQLKLAAGTAEETVALRPAMTLDGLLQRLAELHGEPLRQLLFHDNGTRRQSILVSIGDRQIPLGEKLELRDGERVTLLAPMSGG